MTAGEFCNREVVIADKSEPIAEAAKRMRQFHVGDLVVVQELGARRVPVGIVTDRDVVISAVAGETTRLPRLRVADVMTTGIVTARESEDLFEVIGKMRSFGIRRLPVVDQQGSLQGIITVDDVIGLLSDALADLKQLVAREQQHERERM